MKGIIGEIWHFKASLTQLPLDVAFEALAPGALVINDQGRVEEVGSPTELRKKYPRAEWKEIPDSLILPGFVDTHIHFPQMDIIGAVGQNLLGWLEKVTFPEEIKFSQSRYAKNVAPRFVTELIAHGTTTACIFSSSHESATHLLFEELEKRGLRAVVGKVSMDRQAPAELLVPADRDMKETETLISEWNGKDGRLWYALTPRFALSCSEALLRGLGEIAAANPNVRIQTHFAESEAEIAEVKRLFPQAKNYLSVYESAGLLRANTVLAHSIHVSPAEWTKLAGLDIALSHCPSSNLFLGSGLFSWNSAREHKLRFGLGTDIGAGTSFSLFQTMNEAHKVQRLRNQVIHPLDLFYTATLGGAEALALDAETGNFTPGKSADFQILSPTSHRLLEERWHGPSMEKLSALIHHADDRLVKEVYVKGRRLV